MKTTDFMERGPAPIPEHTACKHSQKTCDKCGTNGKQDAKHTTKGGRGIVGGLITQNKKNKR